MKPIYKFNDFLKKQIGNLPKFKRKNGLNLVNFHFRWKRVSLRENVSLRVCQKFVTQGKSTVNKIDHDNIMQFFGRPGKLIFNFMIMYLPEQVQVKLTDATKRR